MKALLAFIIFTFPFAVCVEAASPRKITEKEAVQIAKKQLVTARPDLEVKDVVPYGGFMTASPASGGKAKWVIGFETIDKKTHEKWIYYVTVFPDGRTSEKEIRAGAFS